MTIRRLVKVMPGGAIELHDPSLPVGVEAEVVVSVAVPEREATPTAKPIWDIAREISASVPDEEWEKLPRDLARNFDHYLYGAPKEGGEPE
jgi:hypothetical protein